MTTLQMQMQHDKDPAETIKKVVGNLDDIEVSGAQVLVGTYVRPEKTKGGIIIEDRSRREDMYQGKIGLVLKMGPFAFQENDNIKFGSFKVSVGDWVFYRAQDSFAMGLNGHHCRMLDDINIRGKVKSPDTVY